MTQDIQDADIAKWNAEALQDVVDALSQATGKSWSCSHPADPDVWEVKAGDQKIFSSLDTIHVGLYLHGILTGLQLCDAELRRLSQPDQQS